LRLTEHFALNNEEIGAEEWGKNTLLQALLILYSHVLATIVAAEKQ
jgi:predicted ATP-dependent endonuclease of OLD family